MQFPITRLFLNDIKKKTTRKEKTQEKKKEREKK